MGGRWTWLRQRHGAEVTVVSEPGQGAGSSADGAVTGAPAAVLAVLTADCAPVVVVGRQAVGIAHAGWRGIAAGVIGAVAGRVRALSESAGAGGPRAELQAVLGPVIRPARYEFDPADLSSVAAAAGGADVAGVTAWGTPALDLVAAVRGALRAAGVESLHDLGLDTADERFFSHRLRRDQARQATVARLEPLP